MILAAISNSTTRDGLDRQFVLTLVDPVAGLVADVVFRVGVDVVEVAVVSRQDWNGADPLVTALRDEQAGRFTSFAV